MTNNAIPNVPRELLEDLRDAANESMNATTRQHQIDHFAGLIAKADALLSAPSPAGVDGCKCSMSISMLGDGCRHCQPQEYIDRLGEMLDEERSELSDAEAIIDGLRGEVADLHTTMMAAAVEIQEHWAAHCDEEGYGPANLMHRLERGIASQYGYRAETLVRLESQRDQHAQRIGELEGLLRHAQKQVPTGSGLHMRIDAALSAVCAAAPNIATTSEHSGS